MITNKLDLQVDIIQNPASTYFMRVGSNAMMGAGILIGDKLIVDKAIKPQHKDIVVAVVDGQFLVRRLYDLHGKNELRAENDFCQPLPIADISEQIWGVVIGIARKY